MITKRAYERIPGTVKHVLELVFHGRQRAARSRLEIRKSKHDDARLTSVCLLAPVPAMRCT
jgi:hypothetical protein